MEIASLCRELALLLHAGVRAGDGLALLAEEEPETQRRKQLEEMARQVDDGASLGEALAGQGLFPAYVTGLVTVGERSGRTEEALNALSVYYEQRDQLDRQVRSALLYPSVLLVLMLVVIVVLLAKVLPVFDQVYASLGGAAHRRGRGTSDAGPGAGCGHAGALRGAGRGGDLSCSIFSLRRVPGAAAGLLAETVGGPGRFPAPQ
ncbi:MAG: type II secretion system F family protein [Dysosmobacter sp.]